MEPLTEPIGLHTRLLGRERVAKSRAIRAILIPVSSTPNGVAPGSLRALGVKSLGEPSRIGDSFLARVPAGSVTLSVQETWAPLSLLVEMCRYRRPVPAAPIVGWRALLSLRGSAGASLSPKRR